MTSILTPEEVEAAWDATGTWGNVPWKARRLQITAALESAILAKLAAKAGELPEGTHRQELNGYYRHDTHTSDQLRSHTASLAARVEVLERALTGLTDAVAAELDDAWECNSYHPSLRPANDAARAALFPAKKD